MAAALRSRSEMGKARCDVAFAPQLHLPPFSGRQNGPH